MQPKKFYTQEFKIQALRMVDQGKNVTEVALHFGIDRCTLYRWHTKALAGKFPGFQPTRDNAVETQRTFLTEFKIEKVREIEAGKTISQVARETGVRRTVMQEWYDKFRNPSLDRFIWAMLKPNKSFKPFVLKMPKSNKPQPRPSAEEKRRFAVPRTAFTA